MEKSDDEMVENCDGQEKHSDDGPSILLHLRMQEGT